MTILLLRGLLAFLCSVALFTVQAEPAVAPLRLLTEHSPPAAYINEQGQLSGVSVSLVRLLQQQLDEPGDIELMPWGRALITARTANRILLFDTVRTAERENWFKWVGPIKRYQISLYGFKARLGATATLSALPDNTIVCNYRNTPTVADLIKLGFREGHNLVLTSKVGDCMDMLLHGRVDLIPISDLSVAEYTAKAGQELVAVHTLGLRQSYLAFSKDVDDKDIARWQAALEQSYRDGSMRRLYHRVYPEEMISWLESLPLQ